ncbi:hypothetical protein C8F04DRAFT_70320 [Mycena alexandri]|uniref:Uncharacterized protein n=1 Tax=Mycena alexandri TaxID=1745969 RepID=A0AAD6WX71_9AGAR|nr:hypothetical protein C8F04DRAFT_70320 [Mycena alexandri]
MFAGCFLTSKIFPRVAITYWRRFGWGTTLRGTSKSVVASVYERLGQHSLLRARRRKVQTRARQSSAILHLAFRHTARYRIRRQQFRNTEAALVPFDKLFHGGNGLFVQNSVHGIHQEADEFTGVEFLRSEAVTSCHMIFLFWRPAFRGQTRLPFRTTSTDESTGLLTLGSGEQLPYDILILATGLSWPDPIAFRTTSTT